MDIIHTLQHQLQWHPTGVSLGQAVSAVVSLVLWYYVYQVRQSLKGYNSYLLKEGHRMTEELKRRNRDE